jgi:hypothetical protein
MEKEFPGVECALCDGSGRVILRNAGQERPWPCPRIEDHFFAAHWPLPDQPHLYSR